MAFDEHKIQQILANRPHKTGSVTIGGRDIPDPFGKIDDSERIDRLENGVRVLHEAVMELAREVRRQTAA
jgi:hypothetical protein